METQGSEARSYPSPPAQALKGSGVSLQVFPPLKEEAATKPCAPPFDQRSCWKAPMMLLVFAGLTATQGSTSAFWKLVPVCATPSQPGAKGLGPETSTRVGEAATRPMR